jgi:hypothetical protein
MCYVVDISMGQMEHCHLCVLAKNGKQKQIFDLLSYQLKNYGPKKLTFIYLLMSFYKKQYVLAIFRKIQS